MKHGRTKLMSILFVALAVQHGAQASEPPASGERAEMNFHFNTLGVLQFGLDPSFEWGRRTTFVVNARLLNTGVLPYVLTAAESSHDSFSYGFGLGIGVRHYPMSDAQSGFYVGAGLEYMFGKSQDNVDDMAAYSSHYLIPYGTFGYRWWFGSVLLGLGLLGGVAHPIAASAEPIGPSGCRYSDSCRNDAATFPFTMLTLDLGWAL